MLAGPGELSIGRVLQAWWHAKTGGEARGWCLMLPGCCRGSCSVRWSASKSVCMSSTWIFMEDLDDPADFSATSGVGLWLFTAGDPGSHEGVWYQRFCRDLWDHCQGELCVDIGSLSSCGFYPQFCLEHILYCISWGLWITSCPEESVELQ